MFPFLTPLKTPPSLSSYSLFNTLITRSHHRLFHVTLPVLVPRTQKDLQQSITTQTHLSTTIATHLFTNKYPNTNVVFCPISVHCTLCQMAPDAKGDTLKQLSSFLKTNCKNEFGWLYYHYNDVLRPGNGLDFDIAFNKQLRIGGYGPDDNKVNKASFQHVYQTRGTFFEQFDLSDIKKSVFYGLDGKTMSAAFMNSKQQHLFAEYNDFKVLGFSHFVSKETYNPIYKFTVYLFLPNEINGLGSLIGKMCATPEFLDTHIPRKRVEMGEVAIPVFQVKTEFEVSGVLKELGLVLPFCEKDGVIDMVDATTGQNVYVWGIEHRFGMSMMYRYDKIDEAMGEGSRKVKVDYGARESFIANHPFVFVVRDDATKVVFLMGQMTEPYVYPDLLRN